MSVSEITLVVDLLSKDAKQNQVGQWACWLTS
jgi:hypothetical protein